MCIQLCDGIARSTLSDAREHNAVPDPAQPLRIGQLAEVVKTSEVRRVLEINEGRPGSTARVGCYRLAKACAAAARPTQ